MCFTHAATPIFSSWINLHIIAFVLVFDHNIQFNVGRCRPHVCGFMWGYLGEDERQRKTLPDKLAGPSGCLLGQGYCLAILNQALSPV
jgi:hypothetical protein